MVSPSEIPWPRTVVEARKGKFWQYWELAICEEMAAIEEMGVYELGCLPNGIKPMGCRMVLSVKNARGHRGGEPVHWKARLCAQGFHSIWGEHHTDTCSPVARICSVRLVMALSAQFGYVMGTSDVKNAFLASPMEEGSEVWIRFPEGLKHFDKNGKELYGRLKKSLYGIPQAPLNWNNCLSKYLLEIGFVKHLQDECVFSYSSDVGAAVLTIWVDDLLYGCSSNKMRLWLQEKLENKFGMKHFDEPDAFVGVGIKALPNRIDLNMKRHILGALDTFEVEKDDSVTMPMDPNIQVCSHEGQASTADVSLYRSIIGTLMFIATGARPDIAFATSLCSQFMLNPSPEHMKMVFRILKYLGNTPDQGLVYRRAIGQPFYMFAMVDASYGSVTDAARSHTGFMIESNVGMLGYKSVVQKTIATSSSSAEMRAAFHCGKETLSMRALIREIAVMLGVWGSFSELASLILVDNSATVQLTRNPKNSEKSRHWLMALQWMRQFQEFGHLRFAWLAGKENLADLLTKPVSPTVWKYWAPYFFEGSWLHKYVPSLVQDQLGVDLKTWEPAALLYAPVRPPDDAGEDCGLEEGEVLLPRVESIASCNWVQIQPKPMYENLDMHSLMHHGYAAPYLAVCQAARVLLDISVGKPLHECVCLQSSANTLREIIA